MAGPELRIVLIHRRTRLADLIARHNTLDQARFYVERLGGRLRRLRPRGRPLPGRADSGRAGTARPGPGAAPGAWLPAQLPVRPRRPGGRGRPGWAGSQHPEVPGRPGGHRGQPRPQPFRRAVVALRRGRPAGHHPGGAGGHPPDPRPGHGRGAPVRRAAAAGGQRPLSRSAPPHHRGLCPATRAAHRGAMVQRAHRLHRAGCYRLAGEHPGRAAALGGALGQDLDPRPLTEGLTWDSRHLLFAVREPYAGTAGRTELVYGRVDARTPLVLESRMAEEGVIFSDGMLDDALPFNAGTRAEVRVADGVGRLVV